MVQVGTWAKEEYESTRLACWEAVEPEMTIEPLRNLPVVRDLVVDRAPFERKVAELEPWIERTAPYSGFPEPLSHKDMKNASKALDCIGCMCCYSACPVIGLGDLTDFAGPAPLVQLGQTALDPRNDPAEGRPLARAHRHLPLRVLLQVRGGLPGRHSDRQPHHRAVESEGGRARSRHGEAPACAARDRRGPRPGRSRRARAARAGMAGAPERAARAAAVAARQDRPDQDLPAKRGRRRPGAPLACSAEETVHEARLLSRMLGSIDLRRAQ